MSDLFKNAVASIRMGVEDFRQQDPDRDISAVRNIYAGVLLLAKETLVRAAPEADANIVIGAKLKPIPDGSGGISMTSVGNMTIDFQQIGERAKDFGVRLDHRALRALNKIRNDIEHHYTTEPSSAIRAAISKAFLVAASLFRELGEDPVQLLGDTWGTMLETKEVYDQELKEARATLGKVNWRSKAVSGAVFECTECQSELVEQVDAQNELQDFVKLRCKTCGLSPDLGKAIEKVLDDLYGADAHIRAMGSGEDGPIYQCPACDKNTLVEDESECANCGEPINYDNECYRCGGGISLAEYLHGLDEGLCSWCAHMTEKAMRDD